MQRRTSRRSFSSRMATRYACSDVPADKGLRGTYCAGPRSTEGDELKTPWGHDVYIGVVPDTKPSCTWALYLPQPPNHLGVAPVFRSEPYRTPLFRHRRCL